MALIKGMYYWTKYKGDWRISQYEGTMFWINGIGEAHLADYFDEIDETPIVREQKLSEQQSNCNLPHVINSGKRTYTIHDGMGAFKDYETTPEPEMKASVCNHDYVHVATVSGHDFYQCSKCGEGG